MTPYIHSLDRSGSDNAWSLSIDLTDIIHFGQTAELKIFCMIKSYFALSGPRLLWVGVIPLNLWSEPVSNFATTFNGFWSEQGKFQEVGCAPPTCEWLGQPLKFFAWAQSVILSKLIAVEKKTSKAWRLWDWKNWGAGAPMPQDMTLKTFKTWLLCFCHLTTDLLLMENFVPLGVVKEESFGNKYDRSVLGPIYRENFIPVHRQLLELSCTQMNEQINERNDRVILRLCPGW